MVDLAEITDLQRRMWAAGDLHRIAPRFTLASERLVEALDIRPGERVLDVAGGTGNTALAAARRDAVVTCTDFVPELLEHAAQRSATERLPFETQVADAQALPFPDASFDVATSTFGVIFAPDQGRAAAELTRVVRGGGRIGLTNFTPTGLGGATHSLIERYTPASPNLASPGRWGTAEGLGELLRPLVSGMRVERRSIDITALSHDDLFARYRDCYGPVTTAMTRMDEETVSVFRQEWREVWQRFNRADDGTVVAPHEYLEIVVVR